MFNVDKMVKNTLKILWYEHRNISKVCLAIFQFAGLQATNN